MDTSHAHKIAQDLYESNRMSDQSSFPITRNGQSTDEIIVVIAIRTPKRNEDILRKISEDISTKAVAGPKGSVCPVCNGTGRVG